MGYFPFFVELSGSAGLIVGGGAVAVRKVEKLLPYGPRLTVVAPELNEALRSIPGLQLERRVFAPGDLEGMAFVIAATGDTETNHEVARLCRERSIPVNVVDDKQACTFLFPALVKRGELSVGISTGGSSPTAAVWLKEEIEELLPDGLEDILSWLESMRPELKAWVPESARRAALFRELFCAGLAAGRPLTREETERVIAE